MGYLTNLLPTQNYHKHSIIFSVLSKPSRQTLVYLHISRAGYGTSILLCY